MDFFNIVKDFGQAAFEVGKTVGSNIASVTKTGFEKAYNFGGRVVVPFVKDAGEKAIDFAKSPEGRITACFVGAGVSIAASATCFVQAGKNYFSNKDISSLDLDLDEDFNTNSLNLPTDDVDDDDVIFFNQEYRKPVKRFLVAGCAFAISALGLSALGGYFIAKS